jgi:hypothetical protein
MDRRDNPCTVTHNDNSRKIEPLNKFLHLGGGDRRISTAIDKIQEVCREDAWGISEARQIEAKRRIAARSKGIRPINSRISG